MRSLALLAVVVAVTPAAPSAATSEPIPLAGSGCDVAAWAPDPNDPARATGILYGDVTVADLSGTSGYPATVTLTCFVRSTAPDDYSAAADFTASGSGVNHALVAPEVFSVPAPSDGYPAAVCSRVDVTDANGTQTYWQSGHNGMWYASAAPLCSGAQCTALGPNCMWLLGFPLWLLDRAPWPLVDPVVCAQLAAHAPGEPPVEIRPDGDVYVAGEFVWDCPPYESPPATR